MNRVTIVRLCVIAGSVLAVEALCRFGVINRLTLLPPSEMATYLLHLLVSGEINQAIVQTFSNVAIAFVLSVVLGFLVGAVIHAIPRLRRACDPFLASYYSVPVFVFYPLFVSLFCFYCWSLFMIWFFFFFSSFMVMYIYGYF